MSGAARLEFVPVSEAVHDRVLVDIAAVVEGLGRREGWSQGFVYRLNVILDELASNILSHGRGGVGPVSRLAIEIRSEPRKAVLEVCDDGDPFDPVRDAPPRPVVDPGTGLVPVGGLGLHLVRSMADTLSYRHEDGRNCVTVTARDA